MGRESNFSLRFSLSCSRSARAVSHFLIPLPSSLSPTDFILVCFLVISVPIIFVIQLFFDILPTYSQTISAMLLLSSHLRDLIWSIFVLFSFFLRNLIPLFIPLSLSMFLNRNWSNSQHFLLKSSYPFSSPFTESHCFLLWFTSRR